MKYPIIFVAFIFSGLSLSAQIERTEVGKTDTIAFTAAKEKNKRNQKDRLKDLDLTKEQRAKVKEIRQAGKEAREAIENNTQLPEQEKKKQLRNLQKEQAQKIQAILTEEQRAKFKATKPNKP